MHTFRGRVLVPCVGRALKDHVTWTIYKSFRSPFLRRLQMKSLIGQAVSEKMFEHCGRTDNNDGRRSMGIQLAHFVSLTAQVS